MATDAHNASEVRRQPAWGLALLAILAALVATHLAWVAWQQHGLPLGCGEDGGCAEVLKSRWSSVWGLPVSLLALLVYVALAAAALRPAGRLSPSVLSFSAVAMTVAAAWYLLIQAVFLGAFCPWCVFEHLLGFVMAFLAIRQAIAWGSVGSKQIGRGGLLGCLSALLLMAMQVIQGPISTTVRLDDAREETLDRNAAITLLGGQLQLVPSLEPRLGDPLAEHTIYLMFDYCCPHCRRVHGYLTEAIEEYPSQISLVCLPTPRDSDCNSQIAETEPRFEHACELAQLALAVCRVDPSAFAEFDRWLFEPSLPPAPAAVWERAGQLVSPASLRKEYADPEVANGIRRNVDAFNHSKVAYLPVIMSPGMDTIVGRPESRDALFHVLETELLKLRQRAVSDE